MPNHRRRRHVILAALVIGAALLGAAPAAAHGFSSVVYVDITSPKAGIVHTDLELEYDLLVVSAADTQKDDPLFRAGTAAFNAQDSKAEIAAIDAHTDSVLAYVSGRFSVTIDGHDCSAARAGALKMKMRDGAPYVTLPLDFTCPESSGAHEVRSELFPDSEGYVRGTKTIATYDIDLQKGSAALDAKHPEFSTHQSTGERFWEFFRLGTEHLLTGIDHILFLLALIAGSRRLREVVLAATAFTLAHSVTLILAALGIVHVSPSFVEPVIALSIAVVASWHLWRLWRRGSHATDLDPTGDSHFSLDRAGWARLAVVFCFGLVHGLGFAGSLGIDQAWSWTLLWSLLVFNVGIETVQLVLIASVFPVLTLLRRRSPVVGLWTTGLIAGGVTVMGLIWFFERISGL